MKRKWTRLIASTMIYDTTKERKIYMIIYELNIIEYTLSLSLCSLCIYINNFNYRPKVNKNLIEN